MENTVINNIAILDCTLRDGGYINEWNFKKNSICSIIKYLEEAQIDIIECGFLKDEPYDPDRAIFNDVEQIEKLIYPKSPNTMYVAMIALGDIDPEKIAPYNGKSIDGIRVTFHKNDWEENEKAVKTLINKGYKVFVQPVGTTSYSDFEIVELIEKVNKLNPFAFYLVDTLGIMYQKDLLRLFYIVENNLNKGIRIGFHSHNNLQLSFSNAQELLKLNTKRDIIIDSSVFGMGRGAGNLATELITKYINDNIKFKYKVTPLLSIVDEYLNPIYSRTPWGYSAPYYLAAIGGCHPNYATYLMNKQTINVEAISKILNHIPEDKRSLYDEKCVENLYLEYQNNQVDDSEALQKLGSMLGSRNILIMGPGHTLISHRDKITKYIKDNNPIVITVNFLSDLYHHDYVFVSNKKRMKMITETISNNGTVIVTSNINSVPEGCLQVNYSGLIGEGREADNAGAMLLRLLSRIGIKRASLAGFDGFSAGSQPNYYSNDMDRLLDRQAAMQKNEDIRLQLLQVSTKIDIDFITPTSYNL